MCFFILGRIKKHTLHFEKRRSKGVSSDPSAVERTHGARIVLLRRAFSRRRLRILDLSSLMYAIIMLASRFEIAGRLVLCVISALATSSVNVTDFIYYYTIQ